MESDKGSTQEAMGQLTDDDLAVIDGQRDQLLGKLQEWYGIAKEEADEQVKTGESMKVMNPRLSDPRRSGRAS